MSGTKDHPAAQEVRILSTGPQYMTLVPTGIAARSDAVIVQKLGVSPVNSLHSFVMWSGVSAVPADARQRDDDGERHDRSCDREEPSN